MVTRYGMDPELGHATFAEEISPFLGTLVPAGRQNQHSEETMMAIDRAVRRLIGDAFDRAVAILDRYRSQLDDTAGKLLEKETLLAADLPDLNGQRHARSG